MTEGFYRESLVATLGTQPQVITLAADLLAKDENVPVGEVHVVHTAARGRIAEALEGLRCEFRDGAYQGRRLDYHEVPIATPDGRVITDIRTGEDARSAFSTLYRTVLALKRARKRVHLSVAGGRNSMVVYGAVAAQILFDPDDSLWHVLSTTEFERTGLMHRRRQRDATLVPIPVLPWSSVSPAFTALVREQDPFHAVAAQERIVRERGDRQRREFLTEELTPGEWRVLGDFVTHGGTDRQIGMRLGISHRTVGTHLTRIYDKMRAFFNYDPSVVGRETLMHQFAGFLRQYPDLRSPPSE